LLAWANQQIWRGERDDSPTSATTAANPCRTTDLILRLLPTVLWSTCLYGVYIYLGTGLIAIGFSTGRAATMMLFYGCGAIAGAVIGGRMADRFGVRCTTGASFAGLCAGLLLLRLALDTGRLVEPTLAASSAVAQLFFPAQQASLANDFPRSRAAALAWNNSALFLGIALGSLVGGGAIALGSFDVNLTVCAGIALIGWLVNVIVMPLPAFTSRR
jgi:predicted MFS family arabinose efflux permease